MLLFIYIVGKNIVVAVDYQAIQIHCQIKGNTTLIQEVQRKYKNDREKQTQEMMKIYQEHNCSPTGAALLL